MEEIKKGIRVPIWAIIVSALIVIVLVWMIFNKSVDSKIVAEQSKKQNIEKVIDSIKTDKLQEKNNFSEKAETRSKTATTIFKSIPHEKPIVNDTTYSAMCDYITNYKPN